MALPKHEEIVEFVKRVKVIHWNNFSKSGIRFPSCVGEKRMLLVAVDTEVGGRT